MEMTLPQTMLENRIIFLSGEITQELANYVVMQLLYLDSLSHDDIYLYINSQGGSVIDGLAIVDTMNYIKSDVSTIVVGLAASMASVILSSGTLGKRKALTNASILIHQIMGGIRGQASDIKITYQHIEDMKNRINTILSNTTKQKVSKIEKDTDRDFWLSSNEAMDYGLIDHIV